ncbi:hypothetical protein M9434_006665 [Picochlorum sp. BPE23]|nr:hypothetical protein M9434_006665 [Picochlorum sp. BPE23]KAI8109322.1 hypothetical protein M9435_005733 [Picochlorum sp. BPE23]WPT14475.1 Sm-like protein LSM1B [Picochlorum sp. SENEW3]|mmetsp:Transcript_13689/g.27325  ORF Transcript_13689/g.27325 Transcript_13689/m.27325 type:complete len:134 (+) Transcript_13689:43-444(+)|eukprot:CAMPEP_0118800806 /NCGR_PEP_ID=MMETSP1161-20130426/2583_1 /TAXON_ID=249345 /ORGANISM="Picochlorum oklahomensis, Strain CCMP2329" /LENGTH=133 /DNA_ID=CAMNT_0006728677 /DNA_START=56 /DNA_END=457 /DNA_ORIENTATION=+
MDQIVLPPSIDDVPPPGMGLVEELDKLLMVQLRDGRKVIGVMRSFDQFANIVLEGAKERIIVGNQFGEIELGVHLIRGENVVLLGEVDQERDPPPSLQRVSEAEIKQARKAEQEADKMKGLIRTRFDFLDGLE